MLTVQQFLEEFLTKWETAKHSVDPDDSGNWYRGALVGSKYGVTGAALAKHRHTSTIAHDDVAGVTLAEAATIARMTYYDEAQFDLLPWGPVVASAVDKCYMSGAEAAVLCLQRAAGTPDDGHIGKKTVLAVANAALDQEAFAERFAAERMAHEARVIKAKPVKVKYRNGWNNRSKSYLPGTQWWKSWGLDVPAKQEETMDFKFIPAPGIKVVEDVVQAAPVVAASVATTVQETAAANVTELAKSLPRNTVNEVLARAPAGIVEHVTESAKLKFGEKSTWIGLLIAVGTVLADPTVQGALKPLWTAVQNGRWGGILAALVGVGMVIARSKTTPRTDAVIAAKRLSGGA